jgi:pantoate--beta-alanine ligase
MIVARTIPALRDALAKPRRAGARIALVPTMGAFHEGHLSLMARARAHSEVVVVSLFVNARQFNETSDLAAYPRAEARDIELAGLAGVDYLFAPAAEEMYPEGFASSVTVDVPVDRLEGRRRGSAHFHGVATIVTKLFNIVGPDAAYFGQKDAQQAHVVKRLVRDLDLSVAIEVCPIVREPDGLAMSSRNAHLDAAERERARALHQALSAAGDAVSSGERDPFAVAHRARSVLDRAGVVTEYFELVAPETLAPIQRIDGPVLALVAAQVGSTHLIDNELLSTVKTAGSNDPGSA